MSPAEYAAAMTRREKQRSPTFAPETAQPVELYAGTYHLTAIDDDGRRTYHRSAQADDCATASLHEAPDAASVLHLVEPLATEPVAVVQPRATSLPGLAHIGAGTDPHRVGGGTLRRDRRGVVWGRTCTPWLGDVIRHTTPNIR